MNTKGVILKNLTKIYPGTKGQRKPVTAVNNISLEIQPGEFVTLLGPSGCGKTTTLRMVAGFESPTSGSIYIGDDVVNLIPPNKRDTAMVFQSYALFPNYNVYDNITYGLKLRKMSREVMKQKADQIINLVGLKGLEDRKINQLSGGQQQRVALARALVIEPGVLLFDEPLSNLDAQLREQMRTEIRKIQSTLGITAIYVTHDQAEAMSMSDRIVILKDGIIEQSGTPNDVYYHPANKFVAGFLGTTNFIPGKIVGKNKEHIDVEVLGKVLRGVEYSGNGKIGENCELVVRPEACHVKEEGLLPIKINLSTFMGSYQYYEVTLGDQIIIIHENNPKNKREFSVGESGMLDIDIGDIYAL